MFTSEPTEQSKGDAKKVANSYALSILKHMRNYLVIFFGACCFLSGRTAAAVDTPKDVGALYAFSRQAAITLNDCEKTWQVTSDFQAECRVDLWSEDRNEISFDSQQLIAIWSYTDADLRVSVTFNRDRRGYLARVNTNLAKFKDRLQIKVARKYIDSAIREKGIQKFETFVARPSLQLRSGPNFIETLRGPLQVMEREVTLAKGQKFAEACNRSWDGFKCVGSLLQNGRGETLLSDTLPIKLRSGSLTLTIKSRQGWQNGTAFSALNYVLRTNRFQRDFSLLQAEYDGLVAQLSRLQYVVTQVAGDLQASPVYTQKSRGALRAVAWSVPMMAEQCRTHLVYVAGQFKSRCEVKMALPGAIAQPASIYSQYLNMNKVGSFVQITLTPTGWQAEFTGDQKSVGTYQAIEGHLATAIATIGQDPRRLFLTYQ